MSTAPAPLCIDTLQQSLTEAHVGPSASEVHGLLSGLLCAHQTDSRRRWFEELFDLSNADRPSIRAAAVVLEQLFQETRSALQDPALGFEALLPDDRQPLAVRAAGLNDWCQGFLYGFGLGGASVEKALSAEGRDALRDLGEFTRMDLAAVEESEESEQAYMELAEFVRMAAILIYSELAPALGDKE